MKKLNVVLMFVSMFLVAPVVHAQENMAENQVINDEGYGADDAEYYKSEATMSNESMPMEEAAPVEDENMMENAQVPDENAGE